jgi:hypothetical protein
MALVQCGSSLRCFRRSLGSTQLSQTEASRKKQIERCNSERLDGNWTNDFVDPQSKGDFILQVEETRIADTMGGVQHREIHWRRATLDEAKTVLVSYHAQRNLSMTANFIVSSPTVMRRNSDGRNEHQEIQVKQNGPSAPHSESDAKISDTATDPGSTNVSPLTNPV